MRGERRGEKGEGEGKKRGGKRERGEERGKKRGRVVRHTLFSDPPRMADGCCWIRLTWRMVVVGPPNLADGCFFSARAKMREKCTMIICGLQRLVRCT